MLGIQDLFKITKDIEIGDGKKKIKFRIKSLSDGQLNETINKVQEVEHNEIERLKSLGLNEIVISEIEGEESDDDMLKSFTYLRVRKLEQLPTETETKARYDTIYLKLKDRLKKDRDRFTKDYLEERIRYMAFISRWRAYKMNIVFYSVIDPETGERVFSDFSKVEDLDTNLIDALFTAYVEMQPEDDELKN